MSSHFCVRNRSRRIAYFLNPADEKTNIKINGRKLEKINGEKTIVKYSNENKDGNFNIVVADRFLITVA